MLQRKPVHEIKLGAIRAAIWANEHGTTDVWFNVTVTRLYKTGTTWSQSNAFRRDDLPLAIKAMEMAYAWIWEHQTASRSYVSNQSTQPVTKEAANANAQP
jgi:hypothetical protein